MAPVCHHNNVIYVIRFCCKYFGNFNNFLWESAAAELRLETLPSWQWNMFLDGPSAVGSQPRCWREKVHTECCQTPPQLPPWDCSAALAPPVADKRVQPQMWFPARSRPPSADEPRPSFQHLLTTSQTLLRLFILRSGFLKFQIFNGRNGQEGWTASLCQISSKSVQLRPRYGYF